MAGEQRIVWRCWKCGAELAEMEGAFERPQAGTWKNLGMVKEHEIFIPAGEIGYCKGCGAYNVLQPAGMHARLQEEEKP